MRWTEEQMEFRRALRRFTEREVLPNRAALELGDAPPYDVLRRYYEEFGVGEAALRRFHESLDAGRYVERPSTAEVLLPIVELSRCGPGLVTALGVSTSLAASTIIRAGTEDQKRRWAPDLLTLKTIGAWALTEADSGSDAFGGMRSTARPVDGGYVIRGSKTFITNGPFADTIVYFARLVGDEQDGPEIATFVLDGDTPGVVRSAPVRKMGLHSSPTGELFVDDAFVQEDRRLGGQGAGGEGAPRGAARDRARATFAAERASVAAMALGVIEQCLELSVEYARSRVQFGRSISEFQLVQELLAEMEVARMNVEHLVAGYIADVDGGARPTLGAASAMKLYAARAAVAVASNAVQIFGGSGYMSENHVEQLYRDARVLQIYGGTDQIQILQVAKELL